MKHGLGKTACFLLALAVLGLAGCSGSLSSPPPPAGNLHILAPGGSRSAVDAVQEHLTYVVEFSGPAGKDPETLEPGSGGRTVTLEPGDWELHVRALTPAQVLAGTGGISVTIASGQTVTVSIPMELAVETFYVKDGAPDDGDGLSPATAFGTLNRAVAAVGYGKNDIQTITVIGSIPVTGEITIDRDLAIIAAGEGGALKRELSYTTGPVLRVSPGKTLSLSGVIVDGNNISATASLVVISGTLNLDSGAAVQNGVRTGAGTGGGLRIQNGGFVTMYAGAVISGNSAHGGGGVFVAPGGSFTMHEGARIAGNSAGAYGGGGLVVDDGGTFVMSGGLIDGNDAGWGGGVYVGSSDAGTARFAMSGGTIRNNTAITGGAGVWLHSGVFELQGSGVAADNNEVYLETGKKISITGDLTPNLNVDAGGPAFSATIAAASLVAGTAVLDGDFAGDYAGLIAVGGAGPGTAWEIDSNGQLAGPFISSFSSLKTAIDAASSALTVRVKAPFTMDATGSNAPIAIGASKNITITTGSNGGCTIKRDSAYKGAFFNITSSGSLTLTAASGQTLTLDGGSGDWITSTAPLITSSGGTLELGEGSVLQNNTNDGTSGTANGGAVQASGGSVIISGGKVTGNEARTSGVGGGGVYVNGGTFEMTGGVISNNMVSNGGGGGVYLKDLSSDATISGGYIYGNQAFNNGGGIFFSDSAASKTLTLQNVYIGVDENGQRSEATVNKANGSGTNGGLGGGIFVHTGTVNMQSGYVIGNKGYHGGGVALGMQGNSDAVFNMTGGYICRNTGDDCGGVYVNDGNHTFDGTGATTAEIKANTKSDDTSSNYFVAGAGTFTKGSVLVGGEDGVSDTWDWPPSP